MALLTSTDQLNSPRANHHGAGTACLGTCLGRLKGTKLLKSVADLLADLIAIDGALVLTQNLEIVGFGVEIRAPYIALDQVHRALDLEGEHLQAEPADQGGPRHQAAYRLCEAAPACLAVAVSQYGGVQLVHHNTGRIIFWSQLT